MADSSKDIQLHELKDMINDLKKMIKTLQATVDAANKREESLTQERDNLKEEIDLLRKKLFGTSSEKRTIDIPGQLNFFNEAELEQNPEAVKAEDLEALLPEKTAKKRKARATDAERFKGVPVEKKYLELSEEEKLCPSCGTPLKEIGEEFVRRELVFVPAKLKVYEYYSKNYECPQCKLQDIPVIKKGKDGRAHMLYGMASAGTVAWVMYQKFCNCLLYTSIISGHGHKNMFKILFCKFSIYRYGNNFFMSHNTIVKSFINHLFLPIQLMIIIAIYNHLSISPYSFSKYTITTVISSPQPNSLVSVSQFFRFSCTVSAP